MASSTLVQEISDQLIEGVSKFTLFVVKLKENNMPAPAILNQAVDGITHQSYQIAGLAKQIAEGYQDFPSIQAKLQSEAAGLDSAASNLLSTCESIKGNAGSQQLADSWQRLSNACRTIADAVITLMEILYSAELERIYITNDRLQSAASTASQYSSNQIENNQQEFADKASDSLSHANHLAQFIKMRGQHELLPLLKQDLEAAASELLNLSAVMLNQANSCMDEPEDQQRIAEFRASNQKAQQIANVIVQKIREAEEFRKQSRNPQPSVAPAPQPARTVANQSPQKPRGSPQQRGSPPVQRGSPSVQRGAPAQRGSQQQRAPASKPPSSSIPNNWKPQNISEVVDVAKQFAQENQGKTIMAGSTELSLEIEKLSQAAKEGNGPQLLASARAIAEITNKFSKDVKATAKGCSNMNTKNNLCQYTGCLEDLCRQLKIMASVKATLVGESSDMDKDEQLVHLTSTLVRMWQQTGGELQVAQLLR